MRDIEGQRIALECLKLANNPDLSPAEIVEAAGRYHQFVVGATDCNFDEAIREYAKHRGLAGTGPG